MVKKIRQWLMFSLLVLPASTNFKLEGFSFGNAGGGSVGSANYSVDGSVGDIGGKVSGTNFDLGAGLSFIKQANGPLINTFDNPSNYYNKLHFVIDKQNNPSDTVYAVAISADNFVTTSYIKSDNTVGTSLAMTDYQTYTVWGGVTGTTIVGLNPSTTYKIKVKAMQGKYSETGWSPTAAAATVAPSLTFDIDIAPTDIQTTPPYAISLGDLFPGSVVTSSDKIWVSVDTNGTSGGSVFVYGQNAGLFSTTAGYTISSVNGDLTSLSNGFGAQGSSVGQTSGGPLAIDVGYTGSANVVGITDTLVRKIFLTTQPITAGRGSFVVKAKSDNSAPAASDYTETLTVIAAANY